MRRIAIAGSVGLLVLAGVVWFAASRLEVYLENNRGWLIEQASAALGREVRFGEVGISLLNGPGVEVTHVAIGDDPAFASGAFAEIERAVVAVKLLPAIRGRYELSRVILEAPQIIVIRAPEGFNFQSISSGNSNRGGATPAQVQVSSLHIHDGRVRFVDRTGSTEAEVLVDQIDLSASEVGFERPVEVDLAAAVLGAASQNVNVDGTLGPLGSPDRILQAPLDLDVTLGPLAIDLARKMPIARDWIPADLSSDGPIALQAGIGGTFAAPTVIASLDATAAGLGYGQLMRKPAGMKLVVDANVARADDVVRVDALAIHLADTSLRAEGTIGIDEAMPIDLRIAGVDISLAGLAGLFPAAGGVEMAGRVDVDVRASGPLASAPPQLDGSVTLRDVSATQPGGVDVSGLSMRVALNGDRIEIPATRFSVAGQSVELSATLASLSDAALPHLSVRAFGGELSGSATVAAVEGESTLEFRGRVEGLDVASILEYVGATTIQMTGVVEGDLQLRSSGFGAVPADRAPTAVGEAGGGDPDGGPPAGEAES